MLLFQPPPPTRYDLRFSIVGIPVSVHPLFWLITLLLAASGDLLLIPIWIFVVFVSILVHELGHAFHNHCQVGKTPQQCETPLTLAESASLFCETLVTDQALAKAVSPVWVSG